ncbi:MAG: uncharacterized protein KVP18_004054 [Porospora cf. gigantea A]|uniref:uncharacterized protein n=1 Tax=Porospora cf. gigantea A TaxID=2853593 RepID=UPI00355A593A|nr:MAG: hypothetical protein KVP18_004054 [Porospora cf. gigantea A]
MAKALRWALAAHKIIVAHRGASAFFPDESREAYLKAHITAPDVVWECDVNLLRDGTPICLHYPMMDATTFDTSTYDARWVLLDGQDMPKVWHTERFGVATVDVREPLIRDGSPTFELLHDVEERDHEQRGTAVTLRQFLDLALDHGATVMLEPKHSSFYLAQEPSLDIVGIIERELDGFPRDRVWMESFEKSDIERLASKFATLALVQDREERSAPLLGMYERTTTGHRLFSEMPDDTTQMRQYRG